MSHLMDFKGENESMATDLNLLYLIPDSNIYIMDNHLAASWCWVREIDITKSYSLVHIDKHNDLANFPREEAYNIGDIRNGFNSNSIDEITSLTYDLSDYEPADSRNIKIVDWANYICFFQESFPNTITSSRFITDESEPSPNPLPDDFEMIDMSNLINVDLRTNIIFNLDLDFFFQDDKDDTDLLKESYDDDLAQLCAWYMINKSNISVFTIALSPECCGTDGTWDRSKQVLQDVLNLLSIEYNLEQIFPQ